jgi:hypothetical protein
MTDLTIDATKVRLVRHGNNDLETGPVGETGTAGEYYRLNTTTGKLENGNATTPTELGRIAGILLDSVPTANLTGTIVLAGSGAIIDLGDALDALAFNAPVYVSDTDGKIADSAGTEEKIIGRVVPGWNATTADKLLQLIDDPIAAGA